MSRIDRAIKALPRNQLCGPFSKTSSRLVFAAGASFHAG